jgi:hypothetical protein
MNTKNTSKSVLSSRSKVDFFFPQINRGGKKTMTKEE